MTYDCFTFFNELDLLEIRFNLLDQDVDKFVLCESRQTFSGNEKPLYYLENKERFSPWNDKVIHIIAPNFETDSAFERAAFQKDFIRTALVNLQNEDVIYYGDVDEIWTPQNEEGKLKQLNYSYFLNNRSSEEWIGTNMVKAKNLRNLNDLRADHSRVLDNGGWHFTNMGGPEQIRKKLESYDHQEMNTRENQLLIEERMKDGEDYAGRSVDWQGKPFLFTVDELQLPKYILDNKEKYATYFK